MAKRLVKHPSLAILHLLARRAVARVDRADVVSHAGPRKDVNRW